MKKSLLWILSLGLGALLAGGTVSASNGAAANAEPEYIFQETAVVNTWGDTGRSCSEETELAAVACVPAVSVARCAVCNEAFCEGACTRQESGKHESTCKVCGDANCDGSIHCRNSSDHHAGHHSGGHHEH